MSTLGERIEEVRTRAGLNQTRFGAIGGVGKHTQINYEKGERFPDTKYLIRLADAGFDVGYIIGCTPRKISTLVVEENQPAPYLDNSLSARLSSLTLTDDDAAAIIALAEHLSRKNQA